MSYNKYSNAINAKGEQFSTESLIMSSLLLEQHYKIKNKKLQKFPNSYWEDQRDWFEFLCKMSLEECEKIFERYYRMALDLAWIQDIST